MGICLVLELLNNIVTVCLTIYRMTSCRLKGLNYFTFSPARWCNFPAFFWFPPCHCQHAHVSLHARVKEPSLFMDFLYGWAQSSHLPKSTYKIGPKMDGESFHRRMLQMKVTARSWRQKYRPTQDHRCRKTNYLYDWDEGWSRIHAHNRVPW